MALVPKRMDGRDIKATVTNYFDESRERFVCTIARKAFPQCKVPEPSVPVFIPFILRAGAPLPHNPVSGMLHAADLFAGGGYKQCSCRSGMLRNRQIP